LTRSVWPEPVEKVARFLRDSMVEARVEEFSDGTPTAEDAANAVGCSLGQIVKSLVFLCDGRPILVLVPGDRRADPLPAGIQRRQAALLDGGPCPLQAPASQEGAVQVAGERRQVDQ